MSIPMRCLIYLGLALCPFTALGEDAVIVGVYEDCKLVTSTVIVDRPQLFGARARAESAARGLGFEEGVSAMIRELEAGGAESISVQRRGFAGCAPASSGNFVEAVATYCAERLISAEVRVDRVVFAQTRATGVSFEDFVRNTQRRLQQSGVWDTPRIVIHSNECGAAQPGQSRP